MKLTKLTDSFEIIFNLNDEGKSDIDFEAIHMVCGINNSHLNLIEKTFGIRIYQKDAQFRFVGDKKRDIFNASFVIQALYEKAVQGEIIDELKVHELFQKALLTEAMDRSDHLHSSPLAEKIQTPKMTIEAKGPRQIQYIQHMREHPLVFGMGPAGTGKTYLAVARAIEAFIQGKVERIVLTRPAIEAGEHLGFLPGDLNQKVDPFLRPLYDALYAMLGFDQVNKMQKLGDLEIAPLAFMRGRTLSKSFIILDEGQNTTREQMKMFLTRIGFGSQAVVTGDLSQVDLLRPQESGMLEAEAVLKSIDSIKFVYFESSDVMRHTLVRKIVDAYGRYNQRKG